MNNAQLFFCLITSILCHTTQAISYNNTVVNNHTLETSIHIPLQQQELLYKDLIQFSVDHPAVTLSEWHANHDAADLYDSVLFQETKKAFSESVSLTIQAIKNPDTNLSENVHLHCTYFTSASTAPHHEVIPLSFADKKTTTKLATPTPHAAKAVAEKPAATPDKTKKSKQSSTSWSDSLARLIERTSSLPMRMLLVFLLGVLLSLTPCIYPMIPITIGILQGHGGKSLWYNIAVSLIYTAGMATTFACFGLLAGCVGPLCGTLLMKPAFIIGLVCLLGYFAFSMFGLYDVYVPSLLKPSHKTVKQGSLFSAFVFGAASGTIASPCVSPGLALLLSIVATLGNWFLGFLLLFAFGVGLSTPLLIVGTFSSSLTMLPQAGWWMIEIKKLFGFMMLGMCFYYLSYVVPFALLLWPAALLLAGVGIYYCYAASHRIHTTFWKMITASLGILLLALSVVLFVRAYRLVLYPETCSVEQHDNCWWTEYADAQHYAKTAHKKLFIDCWAQFCSICIAINKGLLSKPEVIDALHAVVPVKIDGTFDTNASFAQVKKQYAVTGFPTFLLVDAETGTVLKRWGSELYSMKPEDFIAQLNELLA